MAEFQEVHRQKSRMCKKFFKHCGDCPLNTFESCAYPADDVLPAYEAVIMGWARDNPEQKYPTWIEWQQKTFPTATTMICPKQFISKDEAGCVNKCCHECVNQPIPEEIAKLLGIQKE